MQIHPIVIRLRIDVVDDELEESNGKNKEPSERANLLEGHGPAVAVPMVDSGHPGDARTSGGGILSRSSTMSLCLNRPR